MDAVDRRLAVSWSPVAGATGYKVAARLKNGVEPFAWSEYEATAPPHVITDKWAAMSGLEYEVRAASVNDDGQSAWSDSVAVTAPKLRTAPANAIQVLSKPRVVGDLIEVNVLAQRPFARRSLFVWSVCDPDGSGCEILPLVERSSYLYIVPAAARGKCVQAQVDYDKDDVSYTASVAMGLVSPEPTVTLPAGCSQEEAPPGANEFSTGESIATHLHLLESKSVHIDWDAANGGAIEPLCNDLLVVTPWGEIMLARPDGGVERIEGRVPMNMESLLSHPDSEKFRPHRLRVADILLRRHTEERWELFATHHHFTEECVRFRLSSTTIHLERGTPSVSTAWETVFDAEPCLTPGEYSGARAGGRILTDGPGHVMVVIGDHGDLLMDGVSLSQHPGSHLGKLVRIEIESGQAEVLASGLRNSQGFTRDSDGNLWATDHGPDGGDELNLLEPGANYGWPSVSYGIPYEGYVPFLEKETVGLHEGFAKPRFTWVPSIAVSAMVMNDKKWFPLWGDDLLIGSLGVIENGLSLFRVRLDGTNIQYAERIKVGYRVRDITQMPDGRIALLADGGRVHFISLSDEPCVDRSDERRRRRLLVHAIGCGAVGVSPPDREDERSSAPENGAGSGAELYAANCSACHSIDAEEHGVGPHLVGVIGRRIGQVNGWNFSNALRSLDGVWAPESLARFIADPQGFAPGTTMGAQGLSETEAGAVADYIAGLRGE